MAQQQQQQQRVGAKSLLMMSLTRFYSHRPNMMAVLPFIDGSSNISLRTIDWFVTNYTRRHNLMLSMAKDASPASVYVSYRTQLKAYSKQQFDPFRRRDRITYFYDEQSSVETTVGQLNFFRWMLQTGLLKYITDHIREIEKDMDNAASSSTDSKRESNKTSSSAPPKRVTGIRRVVAEHVITFG